MTAEKVVMVRESTYRDLREALANMLRIMGSGLYRDSAGVKPSAHPDFDEAHAVLAKAEREGRS